MELKSSRNSVRKEKLRWISKQSNRLKWNSLKVLCWRENRERPSINSKCIDWNESSHSSPSNLCSTQPKHKHNSQDSKFMSANKMLTGLNWMLIYSDMNDILYVFMHQIFRFFYRKTITTTWKLMEVRVACLG